MKRTRKFRYGIESRWVLGTLWHYQKEFFGENSARRWGFGVGIGAPDFREYLDGVTPLNEEGLVFIDRRGLGYLTNEGIEFCKENRGILDAEGPHYQQFAPVNENG